MLLQLLINGAVVGSAYALIALSFGLIYTTSRFFHFAHGTVYTFGAYLTFLFFRIFGLPFVFAVALSVPLAATVGSLCEALIYRPLRRRRATSAVSLMASLGLFVALQNLISLSFGDDTKSIRTGIVTEGVDLLGAYVTRLQIALFVVSLALCGLTWMVLHFTRAGKIIRAVADDQDLSRIVGVQVDRAMLQVFALGSALAAATAIMSSLDTDMTPTMGFNALFAGVVAVIVGGVGSIPGAVLGGLFVGVAQQVGVWKLPTQWQDAIVFVILILFLLLRPRGFFGQRPRSFKV